MYDFENHLVSANGITYTYDGDGHRVSKTVNGTTTTYATTDINPTGYSQVVGESYSPRMNGGEYQHSYIYGLDAALELRQYLNGVGSILMQQMYLVHDGHGSVRAVTDQNGAVTDTYDYDAFGVLIHQTGTTPNTTLYSGEQFDPDLGLYYNRARYLNTSTGRFWTMDTFEGDFGSPLSLHKYLYAEAEPVLGSDPSGNATLLEEEEVAGEGAEEDLQQLQTLQASQKILNLAKFAAAVTTGIALAAEGDNNPPQRPSPPGDSARREEITLFRDADGTNPGAFSFTAGSRPFITSEVSLLEQPVRDKRFTISFTATFDPPKNVCITKGAIIDPDLADLGLGVVYSPTRTPGHWSLIAKSYVPTKDEQEAVKKRLSAHAKNSANQR
jgi:RHS repeat-associated protein